MLVENIHTPDSNWWCQLNGAAAATQIHWPGPESGAFGRRETEAKAKCLHQSAPSSMRAIRERKWRWNSVALTCRRCSFGRSVGGRKRIPFRLAGCCFSCCCNQAPVTMSHFPTTDGFGLRPPRRAGRPRSSSGGQREPPATHFARPEWRWKRNNSMIVRSARLAVARVVSFSNSPSSQIKSNRIEQQIK